MEPKISEIAQRIKTLREIFAYTVEEMALATNVTIEEYMNLESGKQSDYSFTFLYRCAEKFKVDIVEILTGENPHLAQYAIIRQGKGLPIKRREHFSYSHLAPNFKNKTAEPFLVRAPYSEKEQNEPIKLNRHVGQEFDYIVQGALKFKHGEHEEMLYAGDSVYYNSGVDHGMIAALGGECVFLAIVMKNTDKE
ncbi:MAG: helix-turn-helix domain-containing protein [Clostridia bacterium]|jgi:transcriptional regulator with XRE-family HTH domain